MNSEIIIMLTHNDKTVQDAYDIFESCKDLPVQFWGFKDVGVPKEEMERILGAMKAAGKTTFLEVVSYSEEECMRGAKLAVELGYDYLMGTVYHQSVFEYLAAQDIKFLPFCGKVYGSPSVLEGSFEEIIGRHRPSGVPPSGRRGPGGGLLQGHRQARGHRRKHQQQREAGVYPQDPSLGLHDGIRPVHRKFRKGRRVPEEPGGSASAHG